MSTFFTRLPRELREKVYKDLLLDEKNGVEPQGTFPPGKKVRRIYPEILRACKQAYAEAIVVLYEQNLFRFEYRGPCHFEYSYSYPYTENGEKRLFPKWVTLSANFSRITKLEISHRPKKPHVSDDPYCKEIMAVVKWITDLRLVLKTLRLAFTFYESEHLCPPESYAIVKSQLKSAVTALNVEGKIEIIVHTSSIDDLNLFDCYATELAFAKQWSVVERSDYKEHRSVVNDPKRRDWSNNGKDECSADLQVEDDNTAVWDFIEMFNRYRYDRHKGSWKLMPPTAATKHMVPSEAPTQPPRLFPKSFNSSGRAYGWAPELDD